MPRDDTINRGADEQLRVTLDGEPDSEWDGLANADVWWVLLDDEGGDIVIEKFSADADLTVTTDGGGADAAEFTVVLSDTETEALTQAQYFQEVVIRDASGDMSTARLSPYQLDVRETPAGEVSG